MARKTIDLDQDQVEIEETEQVENTPANGVYTNWGAFIQAGLKPQLLKCEGYYPYHRTNEGCHTPLVPSAASMQAHLEGGHGGGFEIHLQQTEKKMWTGWEDLKSLGLELLDLRCGVCGMELKLTAQTLLKHVRPHKNQNNRIEQGGKFWLTIGTSRPDSEDE